MTLPRILDETTGELSFFDGKLCIGPTTSLSRFTRSTYFPLSKPSIINPPHSSYILENVAWGSNDFSAIFYFTDDQLTMVCLGMRIDGEPQDWNTVSDDFELIRKERHDQFLQENEIFPGPRVWGAIYSDYDMKSGSSSILLTYGRP